MEVLIKKLLLSLLFSFSLVFAQGAYWQQHADYKMDVDLNVKTHNFKGTQKLVYTNNSPDILYNVYYHLYFNAFQPGSMMDVRSRTIDDPDRRVRDRISKLNKDEIGKQIVTSLKQDGKKLSYEMNGTILEVKLKKPIKPGEKVTFDMEFEGQVPKQIRRSGRDNKDGISYTMTQWYPKLSEYDEDGWHANPYVGREFHGVWGNFDVKLTMDASYVVASTGLIQNPNKVGHGYQTNGKAVNHKSGNKLTWHFVAEEVHDFAWAADPDYKHVKIDTDEGVALHFFYQEEGLTDEQLESWEKLPEYTAKILTFLNKNFGKYPYKKYSVVMGGDGGMEYAQLTMVSGARSLRSLVGVTVHEFLHSWYQFVLATDEALYAWMDEGFTSYASAITMNEILPRNGKKLDNPHAGAMRGYSYLISTNMLEPATTHSDHYSTNSAYGVGSYTMGNLALINLKYIMGEEVFNKALLKYFNTWKMKHPKPRDFKRVMEKASNLELDWFFEYWIGATKTIDYGIKTVEAKKKTTEITLYKKGEMPMPLDVLVTLNNGDKYVYYIPLRMMRGEKANDMEDSEFVVMPDWPWTYPEYQLTINHMKKDIKSIEIDPSKLMSDFDRSNNSFPGVIEKKNTTFKASEKK